MHSDEIVSNIISLIHSTTQSNYVACSRVSSKIFSYFAQIETKDIHWDELNSAIERFDQSDDHPDLQLFRQLIESLSNCSNDCEERNYTLGRDRNTVIDGIHQLRDLLKCHVDLHCSILEKLIRQQEVRLLLIDLMNLTGMNVGNEIHGLLCDIVRFLCQIDPSFATRHVVDHPIVCNLIRMIQSNTTDITSTDHDPVSTAISALTLLTNLLLTNEPFPIHTNDQLVDSVFLKTILESIENTRDNDVLVLASIRFLLALNLRFDYPHENPLMLSLLSINEQLSCRELIERLILFFNRNVDPTEHSTTNTIIKFIADLFGDRGSTGDVLLSQSDRRLILEIISRELLDRSCADESTSAYLSLLELILHDRTITAETCPRPEEFRAAFRLYLNAENCLDENRFIIKEIIREHNWLSTDDHSSYN